MKATTVKTCNSPQLCSSKNCSQMNEYALPWINGNDYLHPQQHCLAVKVLGS